MSIKDIDPQYLEEHPATRAFLEEQERLNGETVTLPVRKLLELMKEWREKAVEIQGHYAREDYSTCEMELRYFIESCHESDRKDTI